MRTVDRLPSLGTAAGGVGQMTFLAGERAMSPEQKIFEPSPPRPLDRPRSLPTLFDAARAGRGHDASVVLEREADWSTITRRLLERRCGATLLSETPRVSEKKPEGLGEETREGHFAGGGAQALLKAEAAERFHREDFESS